LKRATTTSKTKVDKVRAELESIGTVDATTKVPLEWQLSVLFQPRHARWSLATSFLILGHTKSFVEKIHSMDAVPIFVKCESIAW